MENDSKRLSIEGLLVISCLILISAGRTSQEPLCGEHYSPPIIVPKNISYQEDGNLEYGRMLAIGSRAYAGNFPMQVLIRLVLKSSGKEPRYLVSNAVIVGKSHVLAAATRVSEDSLKKCIEVKDPQVTTLMVTSVGSSKYPNGLNHEVESITVHPNFSCTIQKEHPLYENNIIIAKIKGVFLFRVNERGGINRACMPKKNVDYGKDDQEGVYAGFGSPLGYMNYSKELFADGGLCQERLKNKFPLPDNMTWSDSVCMGSNDKKFGLVLCRWDAGGALYREINSRYELVGIYSHAPQTGACSKYSIFSRVASHYEWLSSIVPDLKTV